MISLADEAIDVIQDPPVDTDGDGLWNHWETHGIDGRQLPGHPNPLRKDVYVYVDWLQAGSHHSHEPSPAVLAKVTDAFAHAPAVLRDGSFLNGSQEPGIAMHVIRGAAIPEDELNDTITESEARATLNALRESSMPSWYRHFSRYVLFGHDVVGSDGRTSGLGSPGLPTLIADLSSHPQIPAQSLDKAVAGTVMHQLGHSLGLGHDGPFGAGTHDEDCNHGPNHLSVMNDSFQLHGLVERVTTSVGARDWVHGDTLDYSRYSSEDLPAVDESALEESGGLNGAAAVGDMARRGTVYFCANGGPDGDKRKMGLGGAVDWNCSDATDRRLVAVSVDRDVSLTEHTAADEWAALVFRMGDIGSFHPGASLDRAGDHSYPREASIERLLSAGPLASREVVADIHPSGGKWIDRLSRSRVSVAVLGARDFSPADQLDTRSITFGRQGYEARARNCKARDVNGDRRRDLVCEFDVFELGYDWSHVMAFLKEYGPALAGPSAHSCANHE